MSEQKKPSIEIEHFSFYYPEQAENNGLIKFVHQNVHNRSLQRCAQVTLIFFDEIGVFFYFVSQ